METETTPQPATAAQHHPAPPPTTTTPHRRTAHSTRRGRDVRQAKDARQPPLTAAREGEEWSAGQHLQPLHLRVCGSSTSLFPASLPLLLRPLPLLFLQLRLQLPHAVAVHLPLLFLRCPAVPPPGPPSQAVAAQLLQGRERRRRGGRAALCGVRAGEDDSLPLAPSSLCPRSLPPLCRCPLPLLHSAHLLQG